jgi:hypothetical protein
MLELRPENDTKQLKTIQHYELYNSQLLKFYNEQVHILPRKKPSVKTFRSIPFSSEMKMKSYESKLKLHRIINLRLHHQITLQMNEVSMISRIHYVMPKKV